MVHVFNFGVAKVMMRRVLLRLVVMHQLQRFRNRVLRFHLGVFGCVTPTQLGFVDAHDVGSASVDGVHNQRPLPLHPRILGRSRLALLLLLEINLLDFLPDIAGRALLQIDLPCQFHDVLHFGWRKEILNFKDAGGTTQDGQCHVQESLVGISVLRQNALILRLQNAVFRRRWDRSRQLSRGNVHKVGFLRCHPMLLPEMVSTPHEMFRRWPHVVGQVGATGEVEVMIVELQRLVPLQVHGLFHHVQTLQIGFRLLRIPLNFVGIVHVQVLRIFTNEVGFQALERIRIRREEESVPRKAGSPTGIERREVADEVWFGIFVRLPVQPNVVLAQVDELGRQPGELGHHPGGGWRIFGVEAGDVGLNVRHERLLSVADIVSHFLQGRIGTVIHGRGPCQLLLFRVNPGADAQGGCHDSCDLHLSQQKSHTTVTATATAICGNDGN
mmetsp:Transcript_25623/g.71605  ORF Transcript_25623/g.71605 Transcript_25623/m.71605 type:complete len:442 (-) Transcript_25623:61-1386(-)